MNFQEFLSKYQKVPVEHYPHQVDKKPLVSISVVTYQHANYLCKCIDGILMQKTDFSFEVLLGDDVSEDGTREICIEYAQKYPDKIKLFLHRRENNISIEGQATGRFNFVYNLFSARGKYFAICEGDDYWTDPLKLQKQVDFLEENGEYAAAYHSAKLINEKGKIIKESVWGSYRSHSQEDLLYSKGEMITNTVLFRNKLNDLSKMMTVVNADTFLFHKIGEIGGGKFMSNIKPSCYRVHEGGVFSLKGNLFKLKSALDTYSAIADSLKEKGNSPTYVYYKASKVLSSFMVNELRNKNLLNYFNGLKIVLAHPLIRYDIFLKVHFLSIYRLIVKRFLKLSKRIQCTY